jgi:imidazolonepropionase-like amidohydrolase
MIRKTLFICFGIFTGLINAQIKPQNGTQESKAPFYALKNATIIVSPEKTIANGTLLVQGDRILEVGTFVILPEGTVEIDCKNKVIIPSFIESYSGVGLPKPTQAGFSMRPQLESNKKGAYYWNEAIHPESHASELYEIDSKANEELLKLGFGFALTHVQDGIMRGTGALVSLGNENSNKQLVSPYAAQVISFEKGVSKQTYPSSQMGSIALIRQALYDLKWYVNATEKEVNISLEELNKHKELPYLFKTNDKWEIFRAKKIADEFGYRFNYLGSGNEYMALNELKNFKDFIVLPINFPEPFEVKDPYVARQIPLSDLKHWELAPSNPHAMKSANVPFCFTSLGQKNYDGFWKNIRKTIDRGLTPQDALAALTLNAAKMLKLEGQLGSLEKGKLASFSIYSADPFKENALLLEMWMLGEQRVLQAISSHDITGTYNVNIEGHMYPLEISGSREKPEAKIQAIKTNRNDQTQALKRDTITPKVFVQLTGDDLVLQFNLNDDHYNGSMNLHAKVRSKFGVFEGDAFLPNGKMVQWSAIRNGDVAKKESTLPTSVVDTTICQRIWFPNMAYGFDEKPTQETLVFRDATIWTNEDQGVLKNATVIVENGKIKFVGNGTYTIPNGAKVIDAKGKHLTSGIIDEHSHIAISKGVNEGGQAISAEVSIADVVNSDDINIYRQLAGGVTAAQLLHGSANPIGGQSALIKLKWGFSPQEMLIPNAPKFIKCALGENVKQANWGDFNTVRFPQTRMGVEQVFYDGFERAKAYEKEWNDFTSDKKGNLKEPRKDLELEVLLEILKSQRFISCHSYVQSEINMLMHVADSMGFKINTFTHILEGYKVADKMKEHGAGGSTFSDWWAYKYEVNDAIPYNAKMMADQGIVVSINSDDAEMGRRLNQEAAKSVKYGGMSEVEAWKMVTLNPAKLLHLDDRMGSVAVGKDADLVLWTDNPLSIQAKSDMTIVDGVVVYDSKRDYQMRVLNQEEKARLISKMLESNDKGEPSRPFTKKKSKHFHCDTFGEEGSEEENHH